MGCKFIVSVIAICVTVTTAAYIDPWPPTTECPTPVPQCLVFPCAPNIARCRCFPEATCVPTCFCSADYFVGRKKVNCEDCVDPPSKCPPGVPTVFCFDNPCRTATCECVPDAKCRANYCGGCFAEFFKNGRRVNCNRCTDSICPPGVPIVNCFVNPCRTATCECFPEAKCRANYCGGCFADFFKNGRRVNCNRCTGSICPPGVPIVNCFDNPCRTATCDCFPEAKCRANYCGGCHADFFKNGERVNCHYCTDRTSEEDD